MRNIMGNLLMGGMSQVAGLAVGVICGGSVIAAVVTVAGLFYLGWCLIQK